MTLRAYAKINLGLRVLRKREDGYHDIETVFHRIDLADELVLEPATDLTLQSSGLPVPAGEENLCLRAARVIQNACGPLRGAHLRLHKNIPAGAGLGGGSADAAATLVGLNAFWQLRLSDAMLASLGLQIGSDVPYFLRPGSAAATGRGEVLDYFDLDLPYAIVTVYPGVHVSTAWAYAQVHPAHAPGEEPLKALWTAHLHAPERLRATVRNDFEEPVAASHPAIAALRDELTARGACFAQMSGSGSAVYGLFDELPRAVEAADALRKHSAVCLTRPHWRAEQPVR